MGSDCSTSVEHMPRNREVVGLNPARYWIFSILYPFSSATLIQVPRGDATLLIFSLAVQLEASKLNKHRLSKKS